MRYPIEKERRYDRYHNQTIRSRIDTNKTYLILSLPKVDLNRAGLGWHIIEMLGGIRAAIEHGFIPVIDWQSYPIPNYVMDVTEADNVWEFFFEQPCGCGLTEAYDSEDYCLVDSILDLNGYKTVSYTDLLEFDHVEGKKWRYYFQKYIRLRRDVKKHFINQYSELISTEKVLGVLCRGTDYTSLKPPQHGVIPSVDEMIFITQKELEKQNAEIVFLTTEDEEVLEKFKLAFGKRLVTVESTRYRETDKEVLAMKMEEVCGYQRDLQYLLSLYLLSCMRGRIYTACSGSMVSALMGKRTSDYTFLFKGNYCHLGIIVASELEEKRGNLISIYDKPMIFYALNQMVLRGIYRIALVAESQMLLLYKQVLDENAFGGIEIHYWERKPGEQLTTTLLSKKKFIRENRIFLYFEKELFFGGNSGTCFASAYLEFDGAYIFTCSTTVDGNYSRIIRDSETGMPQQIIGGNRANITGEILTEAYIFDYDFYDVMEQLHKCMKSEPMTIVDICNEYIRRKKLIAMRLDRSAIWLRMDTMKTCKDASSLIRIIQSQRGEQIGAVKQTMKEKFHSYTMGTGIVQ